MSFYKNKAVFLAILSASLFSLNATAYAKKCEDTVVRLKKASCNIDKYDEYCSAKGRTNNDTRVELKYSLDEAMWTFFTVDGDYYKVSGGELASPLKVKALIQEMEKQGDECKVDLCVELKEKKKQVKILSTSSSCESLDSFEER